MRAFWGPRRDKRSGLGALNCVSARVNARVTALTRAITRDIEEHDLKNSE